MQEIKLEEKLSLNLVIGDAATESSNEQDSMAAFDVQTEDSTDRTSDETVPTVQLKSGVNTDFAIEAEAARESATIIDKRYELISLLGVGGMSKVFKAKDLLSQTTVAIKLITPERLRDPKSLERFTQEAKLISMLSHANIAPIKEFGQDKDGTPYLVMEYIEGITLAELLRQEQSLAPDRAVQIMIQVCQGLKQAHANGIIHRDLKPSNIILSENGGTEKVQILDFGIARILEQTNSAHVPMTETSEMLGTPWYMSPEACFGQIADQRSDIYQLGCIFCELLTGRKAFEGVNAFEVMYKHVTGTPGLDDLQGDLKTIVDRALCKNPSQRYQSMDELLKDLSVALNNCQQKRKERQEKTRFSDFISSSNDSLISLIPRRLGAATIDAFLISGLFVLAAILLNTNLTPQFTYESGWPKIYYDAFDAFKLGMLDSFLVWPSALLTLVPEQALFWSGGLSDHFAFLDQFRFECQWIPLTLCLLNWLYHACFESSRLGATPGKIICKLGMRTGVSQSVSFLQATKRHFAKILTMLFLPEAFRFLSAMKKRGFASAGKQLSHQLRTPLHDLVSKCGVKIIGLKARNTTAILFAVLSCIAAVVLFPWFAVSMNNYDLALKVNPGFLLAREQRAAADIQQGKFKEALSELSILQKAVPTESRIYQKEAIALYQLGEFDAAAAKLGEAIKSCRGRDEKETERNQYRLKAELARVLASASGKYKEALAALDGVPSRWVDPIFVAYLYKLSGDSVEANGHFKIADDYWLSRPSGFTTGYEHRTPFIYLNRAIALSELGKTSEALSQIERAIADYELVNNHPRGREQANPYVGASAYLLHGRLLRQLNSNESTAKAEFQRSVQLFSTYFKSHQSKGFDNLRPLQELGKAYLGRAEAYDELGEKSLAERDRTKAKKLGVIFNYQCNDDDW